MAQNNGRIDQSLESRADQMALFHGSNSGLQVGVNNGIITAESRIPLSKL